MKNITGHPARDEDFFPRKEEMRKFEKALNSGAHIQIAAPRRIGKTSLLYYYYDNPPKNSIVVFIDTEATDSINSFYKKIYRKLIEHKSISQEQSLIDQFNNAKNSLLGKVKGINIGGFGLELTEKEGLTYYEELTNFIKGVDLGNKKIILMIDEFPEAIINSIEKNSGNTLEATELLRSNRELRQDPDINRKLQLVYTGSISLNITVDQFKASRFINDLVPVSVGPLSKEEAESLIKEVLKEEGYKIEPNQITYFIKRLDWLIVSQVQMVVNEITNILHPGEEITNQVIESAFNALLGHEYKSYFNHYVSRLDKSYKGKKGSFVKELLKTCAQENGITKNKIRDSAVKHEVLNHLKQVNEELQYDGYINNIENNDHFVFNSPLLRLWWVKHICNA